MNKALVRNTLLIALATSGILYLLKDKASFDFPVVFGGNLLLAFATLLSGFISGRANPNRPASFVNGVYASTLLRLFLLAGAAFAYIFIRNGVIDMKAILILGMLYIVYTGAETFALQRATRQHRSSSPK